MKAAVGITHQDRCVSSALWAAYGDALGFPTELASPTLVAQRVGSSRITHTAAWRRLVGGRFGAEVMLSAGAYSDDTQLRLATCRAIRSDGYFDVESFAKVELPVWLSYCLGAGRGSKAAAGSLGSKNINWFSNFFDSGKSLYVKGGGNGAAMRIQPHVWASQNLEDDNSYLPDVVRNAICTHGDLRGIGGAAVHAAILADVLLQNAIPTPEVWVDYAQIFDRIPGIVAADPDLSTFWRPTWEGLTGQTLEDASAKAADEWAVAAGTAIKLLTGDHSKSYESIVAGLNGFTEAERGSGLKTVLFAMVAAWLFQERSIDEALLEVVNVLNSDTDSIASMAGALLGARADQQAPTHPIQDKEYIVESARRVASIGQGLSADDFSYPDLLYWQAPKNALESVGKMQERLILAGIGFLTPEGAAFPAKSPGSAWQWYQLDFGQTVLCKRRDTLKNMPKEVWPTSRASQNVEVLAQTPTSSMPPPLAKKSAPTALTRDLFDTMPAEEKRDQIVRQSLDELTDLAIRSGFDREVIGGHLLMLSESERAIEDAMAYSAIIAKAWRARVKKRGA
ncbi:MAG: ADP-ribosylglycohydrolase family protein [Thiohalomonadaceae bacterium]